MARQWRRARAGLFADCAVDVISVYGASDWRVHEDFYANVGNYLNPGAVLYIMEIAPDQQTYTTPGFSEPLDLRPRPPIEDFRRMIAAGGLVYEETAPFIRIGDYSGDLVISSMPHGA